MTAHKSKIAWTGRTWNPVRGCSKVSDGCKHCYAERMAAMFCGDGQPYHGLLRSGKWSGEARLIPEMLSAPLGWKKPATIFVNSMSDLFHESLTDEQIAQVLAVIAHCERHTFQILTKRPKRMLEVLGRIVTNRTAKFGVSAGCRLPDCNWAKERVWQIVQSRYQPGRVHSWHWPLPNLHLGVSVENQGSADERIPYLLRCPAAVRWVSAEPLLGELDLSTHLRSRRTLHVKLDISGALKNSRLDYFNDDDGRPVDPKEVELDLLRRLDAGEKYFPMCNCTDFDPQKGCPEKITPRLDWVVVGGESGPHARPMHPDWARSLRDQCKAANVPFFFKQFGEYVSVYDRDVEDPDWRRCSSVSAAGEPGQWLNIAGGTGFHGERLQWMERVGKKKSGNLLDGVCYEMRPGDTWQSPIVKTERRDAMKRQFKVKLGHVTPCPKCGNAELFTANSLQISEDCCETWVSCECGHEPPPRARRECVWGDISAAAIPTLLRDRDEWLVDDMGKG